MAAEVLTVVDVEVEDFLAGVEVAAVVDCTRVTGVVVEVELAGGSALVLGDISDTGVIWLAVPGVIP